MHRVWVTCGTPTVPGIVNPVMAACDREFRPDELHVLSNPGVEDAVDSAIELCRAVVDAYGGDLTTERTVLDDETDFPAIGQFYRDRITAAGDGDDEVAVDVTPGRKFMSAIAFQAGMQFDATHVFYFHRKSGAYRGQFYPEIPRTATDLIDFREAL